MTRSSGLRTGTVQSKEMYCLCASSDCTLFSIAQMAAFTVLSVTLCYSLYLSVTKDAKTRDVKTRHIKTLKQETKRETLNRETLKRETLNRETLNGKNKRR